MSKLLDKPLYETFHTTEQEQAYGFLFECVLAQRIVPKSLLEWTKASQEIWTVWLGIAEYLHENAVPVFDVKLLSAFAQCWRWPVPVI